MPNTPSYIIKIPARRLEWPTVLLAVAIYGGFLALTFLVAIAAGRRRGAHRRLADRLAGIAAA